MFIHSNSGIRLLAYFHPEKVQLKAKIEIVLINFLFGLPMKRLAQKYIWNIV